MIKLISQKLSLDVGSMDKSISIVTCLAHYESLFQANFALMWKNHYQILPKTKNKNKNTKEIEFINIY